MMVSLKMILDYISTYRWVYACRAVASDCLDVSADSFASLHSSYSTAASTLFISIRFEIES